MVNDNVAMYVLTHVASAVMQAASAVVCDVVCHSTIFRCVVVHSVTFKSGSMPKEVDMSI